MSKRLELVLVMLLVTAHPVSQGRDGDYVNLRLKAKTLVIGPTVVVGDVCDFLELAPEIKSRVAHLAVGKAPPPGESMIFTASSIRRAFSAAGIADLKINVLGGSVIRVYRVPPEASKVHIHWEIASRMDFKYAVSGFA